MEKVRTAVIGCGSVAGNYHVPALHAIPEVDLVAVVDVDEEKARDFSQRFDIPEIYTDYHRAMDRKDIDALVILTRCEAHRELVLAGAAAGKHMFVQKPIAVTLDEGEEMIEAVKEAGVKLVTSYMHRYVEESRKAKAYLDEGAIGEIQFIRQIHPMYNYMDMGPHGIDLIRHFSGQRIIKVSAFMDVYMGVKEPPHKWGGWPGPASGMISVMNYVLDGGALASHHHGIVRGGYAMFSTEIVGTEGVIMLRHPLSKSRLAIRSSKLPESKGEWYFPEITEAIRGSGVKKGSIYHHKLFIDDILNDTWNSASLEDGIATLKVVLAAHEAAKTGAVVNILA